MHIGRGFQLLFYFIRAMRRPQGAWRADDFHAFFMFVCEHWKKSSKKAYPSEMDREWTGLEAAMNRRQMTIDCIQLNSHPRPSRDHPEHDNWQFLSFWQRDKVCKMTDCHKRKGKRPLKLTFWKKLPKLSKLPWQKINKVKKGPCHKGNKSKKDQANGWHPGKQT